MADFITMTCKSCGGKLQITPEIDDFACKYCGTEFKVKREGGIVVLSPLVEEMKKVSVSTDKTASELAIVRLKEEISILRQEIDDKEENLNNWKFQKTIEKTKLEKERNERKNVVIVVLIISSSLLSYSFFSGSNDSSVLLCFVFPIVLPVIIYFLLNSINPKDMFMLHRLESYDELVKDKEMEFSNHQNQVEQLIDQKYKELEKHRKIVGGDL